MLGRVAIVVGTVVAMEAVAWAGHRYVMHGWGWGWHRSHHVKRAGVLERNDLFAVVFAAAALGLLLTHGWSWWAGVGVSAYGMLYFVLHDGLVHHRWPLRLTPRQAYLQRLVQAHRLHHAVVERDGAVSFGFLYAPPVRALRQRLRRLQSGRAPRP